MAASACAAVPSSAAASPGAALPAAQQPPAHAPTAAATAAALAPFGFWSPSARPTPSPPLPHAPLLLRYLTAHALLESYEHGHAACRLCGARAGCATLTDGARVWPEGFAHYFVAHGVQPPREVLAAALAAAAAAGGALPARNHLLWQPGGAPPVPVPRGTAAWLRAHSSLQL